MRIQGRDPHRCHHTIRGLFHDEASIVVFDAGPDGLGACTKHLGQVLLVAMGKRYPSDEPQYPVTVVPAGEWDEYEKAQEGPPRSCPAARHRLAHRGSDE